MVKKKYTTTEIKKIVKILARILEDNKISIDKIILFGSYANGTPKDYSDIDLAIISSDFKGKKMMDIQGEFARIFSGYLSFIEPIGYSTDEYFSAEPETFLGEIKSSGKILWKQ